jgi:hypothetical protein
LGWWLPALAFWKPGRLVRSIYCVAFDILRMALVEMEARFALHSLRQPEDRGQPNPMCSRPPRLRFSALEHSQIPQEHR